MEKKEILKNIIINRGHTLYRLWRKFHPEKRPERLLHHKPWSEMTLSEKRMYGGKDGKPMPIKSFATHELSHEECERALDKALREGFLSRVLPFLERTFLR